MELKEDGVIIIDKTKKKKIKCCKLKCKPLGRTIMIHEDVDRQDSTTVSDFLTGYRLLSIPKKYSNVTNVDLKEHLTKFISHFTLESIKEELNKIESKLA